MASDLIARLIIYGALVTLGTWLIWAMSKVRDDARMSGVWGDYPHLTEEARAAKAKSPGGGGDRKAARAEARTRHIAHDGTGL